MSSYDCARKNKENFPFPCFSLTFVVPLQRKNKGRDARVVEWTALEMRRTLTGTLGSNPSLSAQEDNPQGCLLRFYLGFSPRGSSLRSGGKPERIPVSPHKKEPTRFFGQLFVYGTFAPFVNSQFVRSDGKERVLFPKSTFFASPLTIECRTTSLSTLAVSFKEDCSTGVEVLQSCRGGTAVRTGRYWLHDWPGRLPSRSKGGK